MQSLPEFVRDDRREEEPVRSAVSANLTGWETVIFQLVGVEEPEPDEPDSASATAAFAP
jgi:hypothetical protein